MKKLLSLLIIALFSISLLSTIVEAKRFGGGSSFGKSRSMPARQAQKVPDAAPAPASSGNKWMAPLAGLAIGAGLATMLSGGGMGGFGSGISSILMMLMLAGGLLFLISRFKKSQQHNMRYAGGSAPYSPAQPMREQNFSSGTTSNAGHIPPDFPVDSFLRNAKASFIRLQAANDRKDINDVREYTTPEVFAEISMQMQERSNIEQKTEVIAIKANLLEVATEGNYTIASVRFTGQLSENSGTPENIDEIWHIQKNQQEINSTWLLAGIQQMNMQ